MMKKDGTTLLLPVSPLYHRHLGADSVGVISAIDYIAGCVNHRAVTTLASVHNRITVKPFTAPPWPVTLARIAVEITVVGSATAVRLGVYQSIEHDYEPPRVSDLRPGKLLFDSGDLAPVVGVLTAAPDIQLKPGWRYWIAMNSDASMTIRALEDDSATEPLGISGDALLASLTSVHADFPYAAMPDQFPPVLAGRITNINDPLLRYQFS